MAQHALQTNRVAATILADVLFFERPVAALVFEAHEYLFFHGLVLSGRKGPVAELDELVAGIAGGQRQGVVEM